MDQYIDISHMDHVSDLWKIRGINLICLFLSSVLIFKMLKQNNINKFHALAIVIFYLLPFASIVIHWEATSSTIWISHRSCKVVVCGIKTLSQKRFNLILYTGILLALIALFIYQPAYTALYFPLLHFMVEAGRYKAILLLHIFFVRVYFLLLNFNLISCISRPMHVQEWR